MTLEQQLAHSEKMRDYTAEYVAKLEEKLKIAKGALEYYASEDNYSHYDNKNNIICDENCGDNAREALEKIKE